MLNKENASPSLLEVKKVEQPKNLEEANVLIENLRLELKKIKKTGKRAFLLLSGIITIFGAGDGIKEAHTKNLFSQELNNLKTNIEYAYINFGQSRLEDNNIKMFEDKKAPNVQEFSKISENKKSDAAEYLSKAEDNLNNLKKISE